MAMLSLRIWFDTIAATAQSSPITLTATDAYLAERLVAVGSGGARIVGAHLVVCGTTNNATQMTSWTTSLAFAGGTAINDPRASQTQGNGSSNYAFSCDGEFGALMGVGKRPGRLAFTKSGSTMTLTDTEASFTAALVGATITIGDADFGGGTVSGATSAGNNGSFTVTAVPSATTIQWTNASGVAESFSGVYRMNAAEVAWPALNANPSIAATLAWTGAATVRDVSAYLDLEVEFTPASCPTRTRQVPILISSNDTPWVSAAFATLATIPQLTGTTAPTFGFRESGYVERAKKIVVSGNSGGILSSLSYGAAQLRIGGGGGTTYTFATGTFTGACSTFQHFVVPAPSTAASATIEGKVGQGLASNEHFYRGAVIVGWYTYTHDAAAGELTIAGVRAFGRDGGMLGYGSSEATARPRKWPLHVHVPEAPTAQGPMGSVSIMGDSGVMRVKNRMRKVDANGATITQQSAEASRLLYRLDTTGVGHWCSNRCDSEIALTRGDNNFVLTEYATDTAPEVSETARRGTTISHLFFWAYNAQTPAAGPHTTTMVHRTCLRTREYINAPSGEARFLQSTAPPPALGSCFVHGVWYELDKHENTTAIGTTVIMQRHAGEASAPESLADATDIKRTTIYEGFATVYTRDFLDVTDDFQRFPGETPRPHGGLVIGNRRTLDLCNGNGAHGGWRFGACIHTQLRTISLTVTGYTGDGSGIPVAVYRVDGGRSALIAELTTAAGGTASLQYPDDTDGGAVASTVYLSATATQSGNTGSATATQSSAITVPLPVAAPPPASAFNGGYN